VSLLSIRDVRKTFGTNVVLDGFSLEVEAGECVVLIGASGSGKSTLLRCVNLLETVDDGVIELDGRDITDPRIDADRVRSGIGIVFQAYNLFPTSRSSTTSRWPRSGSTAYAGRRPGRAAWKCSTGSGSRPRRPRNPTSSPAVSNNVRRSPELWSTRPS
jgi:hypothetical protein